MTSPTIASILGYAHRIAIVGLSSDPLRPSHGVALDLMQHGLEIFPVNPHCDRFYGRRVYSSLRDIEEPIDIVDVFRRAEFLPEVAREAAQVRPRCLWLQSGLRSTEARAIAAEAGMDYVEDRCLGVEVARALAARDQ